MIGDWISVDRGVGRMCEAKISTVVRWVVNAVAGAALAVLFGLFGTGTANARAQGGTSQGPPVCTGCPSDDKSQVPGRDKEGQKEVKRAGATQRVVAPPKKQVKNPQPAKKKQAVETSKPNSRDEDDDKRHERDDDGGGEKNEGKDDEKHDRDEDKKKVRSKEDDGDDDKKDRDRKDDDGDDGDEKTSDKSADPVKSEVKPATYRQEDPPDQDVTDERLDDRMLEIERDERKLRQQADPLPDPIRTCPGVVPLDGSPGLTAEECAVAMAENPSAYGEQTHAGLQIWSYVPGLGWVFGLTDTVVSGLEALPVPPTADEIDQTAEEILEIAPGVAKSSVAPPGMPQVIWDRIQAGNRFNEERRPFYDYAEVRTNEGYYIDSYDPGEKIVERKFTQFEKIKEETALRYLRETARKYSPEPPKVISGTPANKRMEQEGMAGGKPSIVGRRIEGKVVLEVPVQESKKPFPRYIVDEAKKLNIQVCDTAGTCTPEPEGR